MADLSAFGFEAVGFDEKKSVFKQFATLLIATICALKAILCL